MTFKGVVSFGASVTPSYMATQVTFEDILAAPIDGVVVEAITNNGIELSTDTWNISRNFTIDDLSESIALLTPRVDRQRRLEAMTQQQAFSNDQIYGFGKCRYNFAKMQISSPSGLVIDPFSSDFPIVYNKVFLIGQFAALAGLSGIFMDVEPYVPVWNYQSQPLKNLYSFEEYQQKYYDFGNALASDWRNANREMSLFLTFAYEPYVNGGPPYDSSPYGLYKNFLDGILDGWGYSYYNLRSGSGKIILTSEGTYGELSPVNIIRYGLGQINGQFDAASPPPDQAYWGDSEYFFDPNIVEHGLALWIDKTPFNPATPGANYWTPATFASQLGIIMDNCEWAWIYQNDYDFYNPAAIPQAYIDAIEEERQSHGLPT